MSPAASKRVFALVVVALLFVSYLLARDTIHVQGNVPPQTVKQIASQVEEWSAPKFFRHIEVEAKDDDTILATVREPRGHWSVTVFRKSAGVWKKRGWYLLEEDKDGSVRSSS
jgi:hypothetical protein